MKIGDLVKFKDNEATGLIVAKSPIPGNPDLFRVQWHDSFINNRFGDELEVISGSNESGRSWRSVV